METKKKLLLILPKNERSYLGGISKSGKAGFVRIGLPTVASLTPDDWDVEILDSRVTPVDYDAKVDMVGITGFTSEIPHAYSVADGFRKKGVTVVMGGVHVSAVPDEALTHADSVVIGEAELVWETLLREFERGELKPTYKSEKMPEMGGWPTPSMELLDRGMYASGFNTIQATRGCPFDCDYCAVTVFFGRKFRVRPVKEVIDQVRKFDSKHFYFLDDNIAGNPKYAKELFRQLIPLKRTWGSQAAITMAKDPELLDLYAKSGGKFAYIGFESLSEKNLARMHKSWNSPEGYGEAIRKIHAAGIGVVGGFIFGLDDDDKSVFKSTFDFIMENNLTAAHFNILTPLPGTRLYDDLEKEGRIIDRDWARYNMIEIVYRPVCMSAEELMDGYNWINRNLYSWKNVLKRCAGEPWGLLYKVMANLNYRRKAMKMPEPKMFS
ncbi:MAG: radical SAM protein [Thermodesulfobacteriota bacterium]